MSSIRQNMKYITAEMKAVSSEFSTNEKSVEALTKQNQVLDKVLKEQQKGIDETRAALKRLETAGVDPSSKAYKDLEANLNYATAAFNETSREIKTNQAEISKLNEKQDEGEKNTKTYGSKLLELADIFGITVPAEIQDAIGALGNYDQKASSSGADTGTAAEQMVGSFGLVAGAIGIAAGMVGEIAKEAAEATIEVEKLGTRIKIALGLTEEEAKEAKKNIESLFLGGIVDNREDAEQALTAVMRMLNVSGDEAASYASQVALINKVWSEDYATTVRTASTLMETYGITAQESFDLIIYGLQTSANKNGDLLDILNEYSPSFKRYGVDAQTFLSILIAGADEGVYSVEKAADAFKEFFNKAASGSSDFNEGLEDLHLNSTLITDAVLSGGTKGWNALVLVMEKLSGVRNEAEQARIASKLLGSQWEDVGTDGILAMAQVRGAVIDTTNATSDAMGDMVSDVSMAWERVWREYKHNTFNWWSLLQTLTGIPTNAIRQLFDTSA
ncbi:MAG TPA: phage tail tape measure protein, partial [Clostridia bacterium]|nr:phage tail tape measure protein [Clostridia bacterium]